MADTMPSPSERTSLEAPFRGAPAPALPPPGASGGASRRRRSRSGQGVRNRACRRASRQRRSPPRRAENPHGERNRRSRRGVEPFRAIVGSQGPGECRQLRRRRGPAPRPIRGPAAAPPAGRADRRYRGFRPALAVRLRRLGDWRRVDCRAASGVVRVTPRRARPGGARTSRGENTVPADRLLAARHLVEKGLDMFKDDLGGHDGLNRSLEVVRANRCPLP